MKTRPAANLDMSQFVETIIYPENGLEYATVIQFQQRNGWGIARTLEGEEIHFHTSRCRPFVIRGGEPVFGYEPKPASPAIGVRLCFLRHGKPTNEQGGPEMHVWNFSSCHERCKHDCAQQRPIARTAPSTSSVSNGNRHTRNGQHRSHGQKRPTNRQVAHHHDRQDWWNRPEAFLDPKRPTPIIDLLAEATRR